MNSLTDRLADIVSDTFARCGYDRKWAEVHVSDRPDLGQFQCNGALGAAKALRENPREIGQCVTDSLSAEGAFADVSMAGPGFINLTVTDEYLIDHARSMCMDSRLGVPLREGARVVIDYGGPNVAKPMHVGHLRAAIIGESLKRLSRFLGDEVWGDVHLGDWGLQMGMLISELARRQPDLPYFDASQTGPYPDTSPVSLEDLEEMYPAASVTAREDDSAMDAARDATRELQSGRAGYRAVWQHFHDVSIAAVKSDYAKLNVEFDLWLGESDTRDRMPAIIDRLRDEHLAVESEGALVVDVSDPNDPKPLPPLMLVKSDGAVLYGTTDLATIEQRVEDLDANLILYIVDKRQSDHFHQVFRAARKSGIASEGVDLEHAGFGTMNGTDGKPFKTREGGVMKLGDLMQTVTDKAMERMKELDIAADYDDAEKAAVAHAVGIATLKFADLSNHRTRDYVFDIDRFSSFEGRTGPYLLYTTVRTKSILRKATEAGIKPGTLQSPVNGVERDVLLKLVGLPDALALAWERRAPNHVCEFGYDLAAAFNRFLHTNHILTEADADRQASWLALCACVVRALELTLELLGIESLERM